MARSRSMLRAALACLALAVEPARASPRRSILAAPVPPAVVSRPVRGAIQPERFVRLDRCPGACTSELDDLTIVRVTLSIPF